MLLGLEPVRNLRHRWDDIIRMDLGETEWQVNWMHLARNRDRWLAFVRQG
jgi:hypothetical protein